MTALAEHFRKINGWNDEIKNEVALIKSDGHLGNDAEEFVRITDVEIALEELKRTLYRTQTKEFENIKKETKND